MVKDMSVDAIFVRTQKVVCPFAWGVDPHQMITSNSAGIRPLKKIENAVKVLESNSMEIRVDTISTEQFVASLNRVNRLVKMMIR